MLQNISTRFATCGRANLRCDLLLGNVVVGRRVALIRALADTVDLVVAGRPVVVAVLTGASNSPHDVARVPGTDTGDLAETTVSLAGKLLGAPSAGDTSVSMTLGDTNGIDHLVLLEDGADLDRLLEQAVSEGNLVGDGATVDLDLHQMGLLLLEGSLADLAVGKDADDGTVLLDALELLVDRGALTLRVGLGVLGEGLLLALVPVLVEPSLDFVAQMLSPDGGERPEAAGGLDVANDTDSNHLQTVNKGDRVRATQVHTGGVSTTVQASTISFLCILAPGRLRSRTMVVIPAL